MKYDKSLIQVWDWKDSIYNRIKKMPIKKQLDFIALEAKKAERKSSVKLVKAFENISKA